MTLKEFIQKTQRDYDVYDTVYDACVTICCWTSIKDSYDEFIDELCSKVPFVSTGRGSTVVVPWSKLIDVNLSIFKEFTREHWQENCQYSEDDDEFKYQWIRELSAYVAGEVSCDFYDFLVALTHKLTPVSDNDAEQTDYFKNNEV